MRNNTANIGLGGPERGTIFIDFSKEFKEEVFNRIKLIKEEVNQLESYISNVFETE